MGGTGKRKTENRMKDYKTAIAETEKFERQLSDAPLADWMVRKMLAALKITKDLLSENERLKERVTELENAIESTLDSCVYEDQLPILKEISEKYK